MKIFNLTLYEWIRFFRLKYNFTYTLVILAFILIGNITPETVTRLIIATFAFFIMYGGLYAFNDIFDYEKDKLNPLKQGTPIQRGLISRKHASIVASIVLLIGLSIFWILDIRLFFIGLYFILINAVYTLVMKKMAYVDLMGNSITHSLRYFYAIVIAGIPIIVTKIFPTMLAIFVFGIAFSAEKRYFEMILSKRNDFRPTLRVYNAKTLLFIKYTAFVIFFLIPLFYDVNSLFYGFLALIIIVDILPLRSNIRDKIFKTLHG